MKSAARNVVLLARGIESGRLKAKCRRHERIVMRKSAPLPAKRKPQRLQQAQARLASLFLAVALAGLAAGAFWFFRPAPSGDAPVETGSQSPPPLSHGTRAVLADLKAPVEIRFYSLLDSEFVPDSLRAFAGRIDQLLEACEREAKGKIRVVRHRSFSDDLARAASADGIRAFNLDKGTPGFLGLTVVQNGRKETMPRLSPEWEQALEFDLARAILGVSTTTASLAGRPEPDVQALAEMKRALPNYDSVSLEEGQQVLRDAARKELESAVGEVELRVKEAEQQVSRALNRGSATEHETALKQLRAIEAERSERIQQIAARHQAQMAEFERRKKAAY
jgi:hypothetical protein